jgi:CIC family chloride channel protein
LEIIVIRYTLKILRQTLTNIRRTEHIYMVLLALAIGLLGGLCAVGFRELIRLGQAISWWTGSYTLDYVQGLPWWWKVSIPASGGLIVGLIIHYFAPEAKGHGVPEVMEAVALRGGRIRPRVVIAKMLASGVCIASGGSVGREGPIVQIGSSIGSSIGQWLGIGEDRLRTLVGCGAAAGIAATFNAPVAGALFAVEIILCDFGVSQFSPIVISSVAATVVSRHFLGDFPAFQVPAYRLVSPYELFVYAGLGVLAGFVALLFIKVLYQFEDLFDKLRLYPPFKTVFGGVIIGLIALGYPQIFGVGYEAINEALRGEMLWPLLVTLIFVKIVAVSVTIGSGGSGGIFAPSLFIGAMMGGGVGTIVSLLGSGNVASPGAYALVGMGAVAAAGAHAPITAILIIFELTGDYKIILPLMISCIIATLITTSLQKGSIYTLKLLRRGVDIHKGKSLNVLRDLSVRGIMRRDIVTVLPGESLISLLSKFIEHPGNPIFVVNDEHCLLGLITINEIRPIMNDPQSLRSLLVAQDMMVERDYPLFHPGDSLADVMKRLGDYRFVAPVVEENKIVGGIWPEDVIKQYNAELFKRDTASSMAAVLATDPEISFIPGAKEVGLAEIPVPVQFAGRTLAELGIRKRFGVSLLLIKHRVEDGTETIDKVPDGETVLHAGDLMLAMGTKDGLARMKGEDRRN